MHKAAHICSRLFMQTGELPHKLPAPPQFVAFFCNKPPHFALWVKGLFHTHPPPSHDRESPHKHSQLAVQGAPNREWHSRKRTSVSNRLVSTPLGPVRAYATLRRRMPAWAGGYLPLGADPSSCTERLLRAGPGSIREPLLQASRALRPPAPGLSFHTPINRDRTLKAAYPA